MRRPRTTIAVIGLAAVAATWHHRRHRSGLAR